MHLHYSNDGRTLANAVFKGIFGFRNSGKSVFTKNLLISDLIDVPFKKVLWIYKTWKDELFQEIAARLNIDFLDDLPNFEEMGKQENTAILIDDYFMEAANNNQVLALFSRGRHLNISIILLSEFVSYYL